MTVQINELNEFKYSFSSPQFVTEDGSEVVPVVEYCVVCGDKASGENFFGTPYCFTMFHDMFSFQNTVVLDIC